jgi:hypothetical protein
MRAQAKTVQAEPIFGQGLAARNVNQWFGCYPALAWMSISIVIVADAIYFNTPVYNLGAKSILGKKQERYGLLVAWWQVQLIVGTKTS